MYQEIIDIYSAQVEKLIAPAQQFAMLSISNGEKLYALQLEIVQSYLPQQLQGDALLAKVREVAADIGYQGPQDTGRFMKEWMARHKGLADGKLVQQALKGLG